MRDLSALLSEALKGAAGPLDSTEVPPEARPAAIALLSATIRAQGRRQEVRRVAKGLCAVAALLVLSLGGWLWLRSPQGLEVQSAQLALVTRGEASVAATSGSRLEAGMRVGTTSGGSVRMRFKTGSQVWLEEHSELEVLSTGEDQHLRLSAGRLRADVVHLLPGQRFRIVTPDTELEVKGTRFTVEWAAEAACAGQAATRLRVEEGVVWVRHGQEEAEIHAGGVWPAACAAAVEVPAVVPVTAAPAPSRLAEENRRFAEVLQARQAGNSARGLELLELLRQDFPRGHLEEDVAAEELRLLSGQAPLRAQRAAKLYLKRFPRGYARDLAQGLAAPHP